MTEGKYILIVNAAQSDLVQLVELLKPDYDIKVAMGEKNAFELVYSVEPPDLILLGITSAEVDSQEICRRLKTDDIARDIPVILLSS